jgi:hypothetical protein
MVCAVLVTTAASSAAWTPPQPRPNTPKSPMVLAVGCARKGAQPNIWLLSHVGERTELSRPGITAEEKKHLPERLLGQDTYELIGVADFVDRDTSRTIGVRGEILSRSRVNATGMLVNGHKVAVKGLFIQGSSARINLTSVADLGPRCP